MIDERIEKLEISLQEKEDLKNWIENYGLKEIKAYQDYFYYYTNTEEKYNDSNLCCICGDKRYTDFKGKPYCNRHQLQLKRHKQLREYTMNTPNELRIYDGYVGVVARTLKGAITNEFLVSDESVYKIINDQWANTRGYATRNTKELRSMHLLIFGLKEGFMVDHINRQRNDNRLSNLRQVTVDENNYNISLKSKNKVGFSGVGYNKKINRYIAELWKGKKKYYLGCYENLQDAVIARLNAEVKYFGKFAPQQHLYEEYGIDDSMVEYDPPYVRPVEMTLKRALELYNLL